MWLLIGLLILAFVSITIYEHVLILQKKIIKVYIEEKIIENVTPSLYFMIGLPACGKSSLAKKMTWCDHINKDSIRKHIFTPDNSWTKKGERMVIEEMNRQIKESMILKKDIVLDNTHMNPMWKPNIAQVCKENGYDFVVIDFTNIDIDLCILRDSKRKEPVGESVIRKLINKNQKRTKVSTDFVPPKKYIPDTSKPKAIICDLDGTLSIVTNRSPYDASKCEQDTADLAVSVILGSLKSWLGVQIIFVSGRDDQYEQQSRNFIDSNGFTDYKLYMRKSGDRRNDAIIKYEIFDQNIRNNYNVLFALDDRDRVVNMWRVMDVKCLQVNYGDF